MFDEIVHHLCDNIPKSPANPVLGRRTMPTAGPETHLQSPAQQNTPSHIS